jgi:hypothetical protein
MAIQTPDFADAFFFRVRRPGGTGSSWGRRAVASPPTIVARVAGAWWMRNMHRTVASLNSRVTRIPSWLGGKPDQFRSEIDQLQDGPVQAVEARVRRAEAAAAQVSREHGSLARHVALMERWVRRWATEPDDPGKAEGETDDGGR